MGVKPLNNTISVNSSKEFNKVSNILVPSKNIRKTQNYQNSVNQAKKSLQKALFENIINGK